MPTADPAPPAFGQKLLALRERAGLSRYRLARLSGVSAPYLGELEAGTKQPGWLVACRLADALGVPVGAFR